MVLAQRLGMLTTHTFVWLVSSIIVVWFIMCWVNTFVALYCKFDLICDEHSLAGCWTCCLVTAGMTCSSLSMKYRLMKVQACQQAPGSKLHSGKYGQLQSCGQSGCVADATLLRCMVATHVNDDCHEQTIMEVKDWFC